MTFSTPLATEVRALRKDRQLSQEEFAKLVGMSSAMVGHIESGRRSMSLDNIEALISGLGLTPAHRAALNTARKMTSAMLSAQREADEESRTAGPYASTTELDATKAELADVRAGLIQLAGEVERLSQALTRLVTAPKDASRTPRRGGGTSRAAQ